MSSPVHRLSTLDALRGIAALGVCWYHFVYANVDFLPAGVVRSSGEYGWLGVEMFFVISGFIIPYSLLRSSYRLSDYGTFLLKRIIRLDPPYIVGIVIVLMLGYASSAMPAFHGPPFAPSFAQVVLHLGYANVIFGYPWLNPVFWTLAIELQYYLAVGLLFFAIAHRSLRVRLTLFGCLAGFAVLVPATQFLPHWLFLFMLGMAAFQLRTGIAERREFLLWIAFLGASAWHVNGAPIAVTGIVTALMLGLLNSRPGNVLLFFGHISYSLYLIHVPIGSRVINLSQRYVHTMPGKLGVLAAALAVTIGAAWLLYRYVERPAQQWSSRISYRRRGPHGE